MNEFKFNSLEELYKKLRPALKTKVNDLKRNGIRYITETDIWDYMKKNYWQKSERLTLGEMVNDILSTPNQYLEDYTLEKLNKQNNKEEENLL